MEKAMSKLII